MNPFRQLLPEQKELVFKQLCLFYPFSLNLLQKYCDKLDWELISENTNIIWDEALISNFQEKLEWEKFSSNKSAFKDSKLIERFAENIVWENDFYDLGECLGSNTGIAWNEELIASVADKICFNNLAVNESVMWTENLIDKHLNQFQIRELLINTKFKLNTYLINKYFNINEVFSGFWLYENESIMSDISFITKYQDRLDWFRVSSSPHVLWEEGDFLNKFSDRIHWGGIAMNEYFFEKDKTFFACNLDKWIENNYEGFRYLSRNSALPWDEDLIAQYKDYWNWEDLSMNEGLPWSIELIEKYKNNFVWGGWKDCSLENEEGETISDFGGKSLESGLIMNESIPWSINFLTHFSKEIELEALERNSGVWHKAFERLFNDSVVEKIISEL